MLFAYSVGFGIAYSQREGDARAFKSGVSNSFDTHAFYVTMFFSQTLNKPGFFL
jgi:hypothetical protein